MCKNFGRKDLEPFLNYLSYLYHLDAVANKERFEDFKANKVNLSIYKDLSTIALISARFENKKSTEEGGFKNPAKLIDLWQGICGPNKEPHPEKLDSYKFLIPKATTLNLINFPLKKGIEGAFDWSGRSRINTLKKKESDIEGMQKSTTDMFPNLYKYATKIGYDWSVIISNCYANRHKKKNFPYSQTRKNIAKVINNVKESARKKIETKQESQKVI